MGSGDWLKNIITLNKARKQKSNKTYKDFSLLETNGIILKHSSTEEPTNITKNDRQPPSLLAEDIAATRIQTAFRGFKARKNYCNSKRIVRLQMLMEGDFGKKQTSNTLRNLQSWSRIQAQIRTSRLAMVEDSGGIKQKKIEDELRVDHDVEVEWKGSHHTMSEALARMKQREEATIKRERAMAYAFSHQWRAHSNSNVQDINVGTYNWGWNWMERWIAARPWESRPLVGSTPRKVKSPSIKKSNSLKTSPSGNKLSPKRRLSYHTTM